MLGFRSKLWLPKHVARETGSFVITEKPFNNAHVTESNILTGNVQLVLVRKVGTSRPAWGAGQRRPRLPGLPGHSQDHPFDATIPSCRKIDAFAVLIYLLIQAVPFAADGNVRAAFGQNKPMRIRKTQSGRRID